jgi:transposase-like protein
MEKQSRRKFSSGFKTKVVLDALKERPSLEALAKTYELHPAQITAWKKEFLSRARTVFENKTPDPAQPGADPEKLYAQIGQFKVENDFLKKSSLEAGGRAQGDD